MPPLTEFAPHKEQAPSSRNFQSSLEDIVARAAREEFGVMPTPPESVHPWGFDAMTVGECRRIVASYNAWVEVWNRAERGDCSIPLSPSWSYGEIVMWPSGPVSALMFLSHCNQRWGVMRVAGWNRWADGMSCCRSPIEFQRVTWAGWENPRREPPPREPTPQERVRQAARKRPRSYWRAAPQWKERFQ